MADVILSDETDRSPSPLDGLAMEAEASTSEHVKVDRNFSYAVFISYVEVYNEKASGLTASTFFASQFS
jgi:kinesin family protein 20